MNGDVLFVMIAILYQALRPRKMSYQLTLSWISRQSKDWERLYIFGKHKSRKIHCKHFLNIIVWRLVL